jgi:hypothetical protein
MLISLFSVYCSLDHSIFLGMPNMPYLYAGDFIKVLKAKHASNGYSKMVRFRFRSLRFHMKKVHSGTGTPRLKSKLHVFVR